MIIQFNGPQKPIPNNRAENQSNSQKHGYSSALKDELSNCLSKSFYGHAKGEAFENIIEDLLKTHYFAIEQLKQNFSCKQADEHFLYFVDGSYQAFPTRQNYATYLYDGSNYAARFVEAFEHDKRLCSVIFDFLDIATSKLLEALVEIEQG